MGQRSVNKVIVLGTLGRDAETKHTPSGTAVTTFSLATNRRWKDKASGDWKEETDWIACVLWDGEKVASYLTKGKQIYVEGRLQTRSWEKDGVKHSRTEVIASEVILLGGGKDSEGGGRPVSAPRSSRPASDANEDGWDNVGF